MNSPLKMKRIDVKGAIFYVRPETTDEVVIHEQFDLNTYKISEKMFKDCKNMIDIGANIGVTSTFCFLQDAEVINWCFEPVESNFMILNKTIEDNQLNAFSYKVAIGKERGICFLEDNCGDSKLVPVGEPAIMITLDDVFELAGEDRYALLKVDIEGAEYEMFESVSIENLKKVDRIVMECHATEKDTYANLYLKLSQVFDIVTYGEDGGTIDFYGTNKRLS